MTNLVDMYTTYQFLKRLVTPFDKWKAFHLGIIDAEGHQLKTRNELKTQAEKDSFGYLDLLALNMKKLLAKLPGGNKTIATYAAALLLLKEYPKVQKEDMDLLDNLEPIFEECLSEAEQMINEDTGPVNVVGSGAIAGVGVGPDGEPPVSNKSKYKKNNEVETRRIIGAVNTILTNKGDTK